MLTICTVQGDAKLSSIPKDAVDDDKTEATGNDVEGMLMMAVEALYKEDRELDVQMGLLRVVLQVLQRHGRRAVVVHECSVINTEC